MNNKILSFIFLMLIVPSVSWAACSWDGNTGTAADCTTTEISACVTGASSLTGAVIINVPACSATEWTNNVEFTMASGFANVTSLSFIGAGTPTDRGAATSGGTNIYHNSGQFHITTSAAKKIRISNITFTGTANNAGAGYNVGSIFLTGATKVSSGGGFRVDHITFSSASRAAMISGGAVGVIDSSTRAGGGQVFNIAGSSTATGGNVQWGTANNMGGADVVYFENLNIYCDSSCSSPIMFSDITDGGRMAVRYSNIKNHYIGGHDASSVNRGAMQIEVYNNTLASTGYQVTGTISFRGGSGRVYNNAITSDQANSTDAFYHEMRPYGVAMINYRSVDCDLTTTGLWANKCNTAADSVKGFLGADATYSDSTCSSGTGCEYIDDLSGDGKGYPCRDQIGRGALQASVPMLFWNNTMSFNGGGAVTATPHVESCAATDIQENRDYCQHSTTMPATCNSVETSYTAYTCPHPLTGYTGACDTDTAGYAGYNTDEEEPPTEYTLTVTKAGTGTGTVTSSPAGINCGATCTYDFEDDTEVTLTATPTGSDVFAGWSGTGGCTGTSTCVLTMTEAKAATATFNLPVTVSTKTMSGGTASGGTMK